MSYADFLERKAVKASRSGFTSSLQLNPSLFDFQAATAEFALSAGRASMFLDTGLGKTFCQLEWARHVVNHTGKPVLILAPLAVAGQTVREAHKFDIEARVVREDSDIGAGVNVANYERLHLLDASKFSGVVLDESSILKSFMGKTKRTLIETFARTPYRLCCTATPAPNDYMELGNHCEFLGVMPANEMLSRWFINDTMNFGTYRLKQHAIAPFWDWVSTWARCASKPSDLGFDDSRFVLPELNEHRHILDVDMTVDAGAQLFRAVEMSATNLHTEKRKTLGDRTECIADLVNGNELPWVIWCDTDYEADALTKLIPSAMEVRGSQKSEEKERRLLAFSNGEERVILTKSSIAGFGLNWQHCADMAFIGVNYSYESYYQAVRRCWRFGQSKPVNVHVAMAQTESAIWQTVVRKAAQHEGMKLEMAAAMRRAQSTKTEIKHDYSPTYEARIPAWLKSYA